jgi:hypothetical protein
MKAKETRRLREAQMKALDQLPPTIREAIYYAPANFDPLRILIKYRDLGEKKTLRDMAEQMGELWDLYYERLDR